MEEIMIFMLGALLCISPLRQWSSGQDPVRRERRPHTVRRFLVYSGRPLRSMSLESMTASPSDIGISQGRIKTMRQELTVIVEPAPEGGFFALCLGIPG